MLQAPIHCLHQEYLQAQDLGDSGVSFQRARVIEKGFPKNLVAVDQVVSELLGGRLLAQLNFDLRPTNRRVGAQGETDRWS